MDRLDVPVAPGPLCISTRRIRPSDVPALERFYAGLEPNSLRARFFVVTNGVTPAQATGFCLTDHRHREGFVAIERLPDGTERIVGHLCLEPDGAHALEVGIAVEEDVQHHGIGRRLMEVGIRWARSRGADHLTATMLTGNAAIGRLLTGLGLPSTVAQHEAGESEVSIDLSSAVALRA